jgi:hypothetical protein
MPDQSVTLPRPWGALLGAATLGIAVHIAIIYPGSVLGKVGYSALFGLLTGWCLLCAAPNRTAERSQSEGRMFGLVLLAILALTLRFRPEWLSGVWLGWASLPLVIVLLIGAGAAVLRVIGVRW